MLWTALQRDDPLRLQIELARAGTTLDHLARDICDVPELHMTPRTSKEIRQRRALEYFGDDDHPQPEGRRDWLRARSPRRVRTFKTPEFGRLPRLPDDEHDGVEALDAERERAGFELPPELPRLPGGSTLARYPHAKLQSAVKQFKRGTTAGDVSRTSGLPRDDARRVRLMFDNGLFQLSGGKLLVNKRVAHPGSRYALRYLNEDGTRWLDPNRELLTHDGS
jgi:hypothetical protein